MNSLAETYRLGQSLWLDRMDRRALHSEELKNLVRRGEIGGLVSNPVSFQEALADSSEYDNQISDIFRTRPGISVEQAWEEVVVRDARDAADLLRPVYDFSRGKDGFACLQLSPDLAYDFDASRRAAARLFKLIDRPNAMITIPGTEEGMQAARESIAAGINVHIALLFSMTDYEKAAEAYTNALEHQLQAGKDISRPASVASFPMGRLDRAVTKFLPAGHPLQGRIAVSNARLIYDRFHVTFSSPRNMALKERGARIQRVMWNDTGATELARHDLTYVEELIGPDSVNSMPMQTLNAFREHGSPHMKIIYGVNEARTRLFELNVAGVDYDLLTRQAKADAILAAEQSHSELLEIIIAKRKGGMKKAV